jgi:hypothetical protein
VPALSYALPLTPDLHRTAPSSPILLFYLLLSYLLLSYLLLSYLLLSYLLLFSPLLTNSATYGMLLPFPYQWR